MKQGTLWELAESERSKIVNYLCTFKHGREWAKDVSADAILKAYQYRHTIRDLNFAKSWLWSVCVNYARTYHVKSKPEVLTSEIYTGVEKSPTIGIDAEYILKAIESLPRKQRDTFKMHEFDGHTFKEISYLIGSPYDTVKANYRHALLKLRKLVKNG